MSTPNIGFRSEKGAERITVDTALGSYTVTEDEAAGAHKQLGAILAARRKRSKK